MLRWGILLIILGAILSLFLGFPGGQLQQLGWVLVAVALVVFIVLALTGRGGGPSLPL
jgi:hypothetical protein